MGTHKLERSLAMPTQGEAVGGRGWYRSKGSGMVPFERALVSSYRPSVHIIPLSAVVCPKFQIAVLSGGCEPPIFGKGKPLGVGDGTVRKSVNDFV